MLLALSAAAAAAQQAVGSVTLSGGTYTFVPGSKVAGAVAAGSVSTMNSSASGFAELSISTSSAFTDAEQTFAAGFLEGALTQPQIYLHSINMLAWIAGNFGGKPPPPEYEAFFTAQDAWARGNVASNATVRWQGMGLILSQFDGLRAGYAAVAPPDQALSLYTFQQMNAVGDLLDLIPALQPGSPHAAPWNWEEQTTEQILDRARKINHCSGLFAVTGNLSDVFWGHSAWFTYMGTNRVFKHYKFALASPGMVGTAMSFSSYPAYLSSLDDFYITWSTKLVMVETTNGIYNKSLYKLVVPESLWAWQRVRLANLVSPDGPTWGDVMAWHNSGTYNNAYGVLSLAGWTPGEALPPNFLTYVEQIPGLVYYGDVTRELEKGHMPMYNVPFWPVIYETSGYKAVIDAKRNAAKYATLSEDPIAGLSYQLAPRAKIFRRDAGKVDSLPSFISIMRYNDYLHDPYSSSPWDAICSRGDLAGGGGSPDGCYDTKASSYSSWATQTSHIINGPTVGDGSLPPFSWAQFPAVSHVGLPYVNNFTVAPTQPQW